MGVMSDDQVFRRRRFLRSNWELLTDSDQQRGKPMPDTHKRDPSGATLISLPPIDTDPTANEATARHTLAGLRNVTLFDALLSRRSRRAYTDESLTLEEFAFLLFATQGVQKERSSGSLRPSPSAGARHAFETYVAVFRVEDLAPGLYRYLPFDHAMVLIRACDTDRDARAGPVFTDVADLRRVADKALHGQGWNSAVTFYWTAIPYRMEWRYDVVSPKFIALDAGHLCQNLYLACEAIGCGTCAIGAYDQDECDEFLGVDGSDELTVYAAPVGKVENT